MNDDLALRTYFGALAEEYPQDYNPVIQMNAVDLLSRVGDMLMELEVQTVRICSGWRPYQVNARTVGASKTSYHIQGKAVDFLDREGTLHARIAARPELLKKYGLWLEDRDSTPRWVHLDTGTRPEREVRIFRAK